MKGAKGRKNGGNEHGRRNKMTAEILVIGCGLSGAVIARFFAEEMGKKVCILERRKHIGGNMYDFYNEEGILVHLYGPHIFHTKDKALADYVKKYAEWEEFQLVCGAEINGRCTATPFNFKTIDEFYNKKEAEKIKEEIKKEFGERTQATVVEMLECGNETVQRYARFLFDNDYSLYTAKQWGISPDEIDISIFKRVPIRFSYDEGYFDDKYQFMPKYGYTEFFKNLLNHKNIEIQTGIDALEHLKIDEGKSCLYYDGKELNIPVIYTGAADELLGCRYGRLPYRSLRFEWKTLQEDSYQKAPVVAYPQEESYTRITEYKKLPKQEIQGVTTIAVEYPIPYQQGKEIEPYYPIPNDENQKLYNIYKNEIEKIENLYLCGRLADYKYYNMDQALKRSLDLCKEISNKLSQEDVSQ